MKHKTWFRLVLRAIGVLLVCLAVPKMSGQIIQAITAFALNAPGWGSNSNVWFWLTAGVSEGVIEIGLGLYLFFGGKWIIERCIPSNRPYCPECGYELKSLTSPMCPECGIVLPPEVRPPTPPPIVGQQ